MSWLTNSGIKSLIGLAILFSTGSGCRENVTPASEDPPPPVKEKSTPSASGYQIGDSGGWWRRRKINYTKELERIYGKGMFKEEPAEPVQQKYSVEPLIKEFKKPEKVSWKPGRGQHDPITYRDVAFLYPFLLMPHMRSARMLGKFNWEAAARYVQGKGKLAGQGPNLIYDVNSENVVEVLDFRLGLTDRIQIELALPYLKFQGRFRVRDSGTEWFDGLTARKGIGDTVLIGKFQLWKGNVPSTGLAFSGWGKLRTGQANQFLSSGKSDYGGTVEFSRAFKRAVLHVNGGYVITGNLTSLNLNPIALSNMVTGGVSVAMPIHQKIIVLVQSQGHTNPFPKSGFSGIDGPTFLALGGLRVQIRSRLAADAAYVRGLTSSSPDGGWVVGALWEF